MYQVYRYHTNGHSHSYGYELKVGGKVKESFRVALEGEDATKWKHFEFIHEYYSLENAIRIVKRLVWEEQLNRQTVFSI